MQTLKNRARRAVILMGIGGVLVLSIVFAFLIRFDLAPPLGEKQHLLLALAVAVPVKLVVYYLVRLHHGWWSVIGLSDMLKIGWSSLVASTAFTVVTASVAGASFPRSIYVLDFMLTILGLSGAKVLIRLIRTSQRTRHSNGHALKEVLIYGAGEAGSLLMKELRSNPTLGYRPLGFLDDSPSKQGDSVLGVRVLGKGVDLASVARSLRAKGVEPDMVIVAMPSATSAQMRQAAVWCRAAGVACRTLPGTSDLLESRALAKQLRDISVEDLLSRDSVQLDEEALREFIAGRAVLVTGAAGSIGSELCRQIAAAGPGRLVALDRAESDLFRIDNELKSRFVGLDLVAVIGDIRDAQRIEEVIRDNGIDAVFHAAAYKHVPLMEAHVVEAGQNNILGTWNLAQVSCRLGVRDFVLISSDKAVNPTSVMGATKRAAELIVAALHSNAPEGTRFVSVRFGNVLGSNGSVIPTFQAQIAAGGPVTVTHPEMRRYFMTIREAVQLVLQAAAMAEGPEIFVLDMGQPVRILDLARTMIQLAGLVPDRDIEIAVTGLRPGEKLYEELITRTDQVMPTRHPKIKIFRHLEVDYVGMRDWVTEFMAHVARRDSRRIVSSLVELIPEYTPCEFHQGVQFVPLKMPAASEGGLLEAEVSRSRSMSAGQ